MDILCIFHETETPLRSGVTARKPIDPCPEHEDVILIVSSLSIVDEHCSASALLRGFEVVHALIQVTAGSYVLRVVRRFTS
jgi:hypothetical protein